MVSDDRTMKPLPASHLRIARPSHDLQASERFWADGLGLDVLFRAGSSAEGGHALPMAGWPGVAWHLELVSDPGGETPAAPTEEDLLVLYLNSEVDAGVVRRLVDAGGTGSPPAIPTGITQASRSQTRTGPGWS
jgi:catechol 2,3-dioxygenase-like lactoylglutathione lyase family enzyme